MRIVVSFLIVTGLASLVAAIPQRGTHEHRWHRRNDTGNPLPTGTGMPIGTGAPTPGTPSPTGGSKAGGSSATSSDASPANADTSSTGSGRTPEARTATDLRAASNCGMWDSTPTGGYTIQNLLWGQGSASSGSQCYGIDGLNGDTVSWHSVWTWAGNEYNVKSYSNANLNFPPKQLSTLTSIPTKFSYTQSTSSTYRSDVSYDMFLASSTADAANVASVASARSYEIMVWLAASEIEPTGSLGSDALTTAMIGGTSWKVYKGPSGSTIVISFVAEPEIKDFEGDLVGFYRYLMDEQGVPGDQYLAYIGAGTEAFVGSDVQFTVTGYSCSVN